MHQQDIILTDLRSQGFRITKTRKAILEIFQAHQRPLAPLALKEELASHDISVNKTTVYREIDFLLSQGIIQKLRIDHASDLYELSDRPHHHHVTCTDCGSIEDITFKDENSLLKEAQQQTSLKIQDHALEFYGLCQNCL